MKRIFSIVVLILILGLCLKACIRVDKPENIELQTVENKSGATLPETGGIGTTIFYVVGAVLVIGAGVLFVTKRRMSTR